MLFEGNFILYMARKSLDNILFTLGFIFAVGAYSFWRPLEEILGVENEGQVFYVGIALAFTFYTGAYLVAKYKTWRWLPYFVFVVCASRALKELNYEAVQEYEWMEYLLTGLTGLAVVFHYVKYKHKKYLEDAATSTEIQQ